MKIIRDPFFRFLLVTTLTGAGLLTTWLAVANLVAIPKEKKIEQEVEAFASQFPPTDFNETTNQIRKLTPKLGFKLLSIPSEAKTQFSDEKLNIEVAESDRQAWEAISPPLTDYLKEQFSKPDDSITAPPKELQDYLSKNATTIQTIRDIVLTQQTPVYWSDITPMLKGDIQNINLLFPSYFGVISLQQIIALDILQKHRNGKTKAAIDMLEVAWKITENLQDSRFLMDQNLNLITNRYISGTIRKLDNLPEVWEQRIAKHDYVQFQLALIKADILFFFNLIKKNLNTRGIFGIFEELGEELTVAMLMLIKLEPFSHGYFRLAVIDLYQSDMRYLEKLQKRDYNICQSDKVDIEPDLPDWWNILGIPALYSPDDPFYKVTMTKKYMLNFELTQKIIQVKQVAVNNGQWPEKMENLESEICPGFTWVYQVDENGTMSLSLNPEPEWQAERLELNHGLPLTYRDRTISGKISQ